MDHKLPIPPNPGSYHGWAELLALVDELRRLAHDTTLAPAMRRVRDLFADYDGHGRGAPGPFA